MSEASRSIQTEKSTTIASAAAIDDKTASGREQAIYSGQHEYVVRSGKKSGACEQMRGVTGTVFRCPESVSQDSFIRRESMRKLTLTDIDGFNNVRAEPYRTQRTKNCSAKTRQVTSDLSGAGKRQPEGLTELIDLMSQNMVLVECNNYLNNDMMIDTSIEHLHLFIKKYKDCKTGKSRNKADNYIAAAIDALPREELIKKIAGENVYELTAKTLCFSAVRLLIRHAEKNHSFYQETSDGRSVTVKEFFLTYKSDELFLYMLEHILTDIGIKEIIRLSAVEGQNMTRQRIENILMLFDMVLLSQAEVGVLYEATQKICRPLKEINEFISLDILMNVFGHQIKHKTISYHEIAKTHTLCLLKGLMKQRGHISSFLHLLSSRYIKLDFSDVCFIVCKSPDLFNDMNFIRFLVSQKKIDPLVSNDLLEEGILILLRFNSELPKALIKVTDIFKQSESGCMTIMSRIDFNKLGQFLLNRYCVELIQFFINQGMMKFEQFMPSQITDLIYSLIGRCINNANEIKILETQKKSLKTESENQRWSFPEDDEAYPAIAINNELSAVKSRIKNNKKLLIKLFTSDFIKGINSKYPVIGVKDLEKLIDAGLYQCCKGGLELADITEVDTSLICKVIDKYTDTKEIKAFLTRITDTKWGTEYQYDQLASVIVVRKKYQLLNILQTKIPNPSDELIRRVHDDLIFASFYSLNHYRTLLSCFLVKVNENHILNLILRQVPVKALRVAINHLDDPFILLAPVFSFQFKRLDEDKLWKYHKPKSDGRRKSAYSKALASSESKGDLTDDQCEDDYCTFRTTKTSVLLYACFNERDDYAEVIINACIEKDPDFTVLKEALINGTEELIKQRKCEVEILAHKAAEVQADMTDADKIGLYYYYMSAKGCRKTKDLLERHLEHFSDLESAAVKAPEKTILSDERLTERVEMLIKNKDAITGTNLTAIMATLKERTQNLVRQSEITQKELEETKAELMEKDKRLRQALAEIALLKQQTRATVSDV